MTPGHREPGALGASDQGVTSPFKLGSGRPNAHISCMPHKGSSPRILDLFEYTITVPSPPADPAPVPTKPPELANLSDTQLAERLGQLMEELQRRLKKGRARRPELEAAVQHARRSLEQLVPRPTSQAKPPKSSKAAFTLQEGQRKAVRAALLAGVAPTQVAKHFGLSLAAVRKVLAEAA